MLPFNSIDFLIVMACYILVLAVGKLFIANRFYKYLLAALNLLFITVAFPTTSHILFFIIYSYVVTVGLSDLIIIKNKIIVALLLILPMASVKSSIFLPNDPSIQYLIIAFAGISFATFKSVSYYLDKAPEESTCDFASYFNYLAFTPTLLMGPINRFSHFYASQQAGFSAITGVNFISGWNYFIKGLAFKYIIAETIDRYWLNIYPSGENTLAIVNGMYSYFCYLFFDFAGYSFMAMGIAKMMGINIPVNFTNPFVAKNPQEFWKSFHITLGDWLKDYFFTPLYMFLSRKKTLRKFPLTRQNISLLLTFLIMGCWNGLEKHYILSGLLFGVYSAVHNTYVFYCNKTGRDIVFGNLNAIAVKYISIFFMFNLAAFALYIFSGRLPL